MADTVTLEEQLLEAAPVLWTTQGAEIAYACKKHPDFAPLFAFYAGVGCNLACHCFLCLVEEVARRIEEATEEGYKEGFREGRGVGFDEGEEHAKENS